MSDKKNTQEIIDDTIEAVDDVSSKFDQITEVLQAAKEELLKQVKDHLGTFQKFTLASNRSYKGGE